MLLFAKVIGALCTIAVPASVCGTQAFLSKKHQTDHKKKIEAEFTQTQHSLNTAHTNYQAQIRRIQTEKNALASTKTELTYTPVDIQKNIAALDAEKNTYKSHHTTLQQQITDAISTHDSNVNSAKSAIETLWTNEKSRVEQINTTLESSISTAKQANETLRTNIQTLKDEIDKIINDVFNPSSPVP